MALPWPWGNQPGRFFPRLLLGLSPQMNLDREQPANQLLNGNLIFQSNRLSTCFDTQLFRSVSILFSNSWIEVSPLIFSPLMEKVWVKSTFSTSAAYFWSAAILSSSP